MPKFICSYARQLVVALNGANSIKFTNGEYKTQAPKEIDALRRDPHYGHGLYEIPDPPLPVLEPEPEEEEVVEEVKPVVEPPKPAAKPAVGRPPLNRR